LRALKKLMTKNCVIVIENHYLGSVLDGNQFDTFYHEHPRTYSYGSFVQIASTLDVRLVGVEFPSRYGGNIRVFLSNNVDVAAINGVNLDELKIREANFYGEFHKLRANINKWIEEKHQFLNDNYSKYGKLPAKAFPGRAAILVKLIGANETLISAVFEKPGSLKIGNYLPGTRIPILSDDQLFAIGNQDKPLINLAWHIHKEIREYLIKHNYSGAVVDILSLDSFSK